jgi:hypothetical protein
MTFMRIQRSTTIEVPDLKNLLAARRLHGGPERSFQTRTVCAEG